MNRDIIMLIDRLEESIGDDDFPYLAEEQIDLLAEKDVDGESMEALLRLLEAYPDADFGMPGPIVHFLEKFYKRGYESELLKSIRRTPVPHTLWMLNRIINGSDGEIKTLYLDELRRVVDRGDTIEEARKSAKEFLGLHQE